jgi:hypothetical protein
MRDTTIAAFAFFIASCATQTFEGIPLYGHVHDVLPSDLRTAISLVRYSPHVAYRKIYAIEIASSSEIRLYHAPYSSSVGEYNLVQRIGGKWQFHERVIGPPSAFRY